MAASPETVREARRLLLGVFRGLAPEGLALALQVSPLPLLLLPVDSMRSRGAGMAEE